MDLDNPLPTGQFRMSERIVANDIEVSGKLSRRLIKDFVEKEIIVPIKLSRNEKNGSIYGYTIHLLEEAAKEAPKEAPRKHQNVTTEPFVECNGSSEEAPKEAPKEASINKTKSKLNNTIDSYTKNLDLKEALNDFIEHRKAMKKPMTEKALKLLIGKLDGLADNDADKIALLNTSILNGWLSVYEPRDKTKEELKDKPVETEAQKLERILREAGVNE